MVEKAIEVTRYREVLEAEGDAKSIERIEHLDELIQAAREFDQAHGNGLLRFIEWTALMQSTDNDDAGEDRVHLMTCHAAKGLEFGRVFRAVRGFIQEAVRKRTPDKSNPCRSGMRAYL